MNLNNKFLRIIMKQKIYMKFNYCFNYPKKKAKIFFFTCACGHYNNHLLLLFIIIIIVITIVLKILQPFFFWVENNLSHSSVRPSVPSHRPTKRSCFMYLWYFASWNSPKWNGYTHYRGFAYFVHPPAPPPKINPHFGHEFHD
jgi:hypothetical protein